MVKIPATLSHRERPLTRHSPIVEVDSGGQGVNVCVDVTAHATFEVLPFLICLLVANFDFFLPLPLKISLTLAECNEVLHGDR